MRKNEKTFNIISLPYWNDGVLEISTYGGGDTLKIKFGNRAQTWEGNFTAFGWATIEEAISDLWGFFRTQGLNGGKQGGMVNPYPMKGN